MAFGKFLKTILSKGAGLVPGGNLIPALVTGVGAIGGALEGRKAARTQTTSFAEPPAYAGLADMLRSKITDRLNTPVPLGGYEAEGLSNINQAYNDLQQHLLSNLTARGLGGSPTEGAGLTRLELGRGGQVVDFLNRLPLLQRQAENENLDLANRFYANRPLTQTSTLPGSPLGSAFTSASELLAFLTGRGMFNKGRANVKSDVNSVGW